MKRGRNIPILVISLENNKHLVALFYSVFFKNICRLVTEFAYIGKCKGTLLFFGISPYKRRIIGRKLSHFVYYIISEIIAFGKAKFKINQITVIVKCFFAKVLV